MRNYSELPGVLLVSHSPWVLIAFLNKVLLALAAAHLTNSYYPS